MPHTQAHSRIHALLRWEAFALILFVAVLAAELFWLHTLQTTESRLTDVFMRQHAREYAPDPNIIVVDIDDASMTDMQDIAGLWAWSREIHADLLTGLAEFTPRAIVFDIAFSERDMKHPKSDARLSDIINNSKTIYLPATLLKDQTDTKPVALRKVASAFAMQPGQQPDAGAALQLPNAITPAGWRLGLINNLDDADGVLRRYRLFSDVSGWHIPSLPARVATDLGVALPAGSNFMLRWPDLGHKRFRYSELYKLLTEKRPDLGPAAVARLNQEFHDKIIFIGASATSSFDHHLSPLGAGYVGVDILAVALDNLKNGRIIRIVAPGSIFCIGLGFLLLQILALQRRVHPLTIGAALLLLSLLGFWLSDAELRNDLVVPLITPLLFNWVWFLAAALVGYLRVRHARDQAVALFGRFLNPGVVKKIVEQGETVASLSGQTRNVTVLFSDIRGFTTLSESHAPQHIVNLLNRYFDRQVEIIFKNHGTLDKFIGDCIMAFWGAPFDDPNQTQHALAAALDMQDALIAFNQELRAEDPQSIEFDIGIGIHTGPAVIGFIGAQRKLDYTAIGDTVNLASRVEGLTKGVSRILVTREVKEACASSNELKFELCGTFDVKGRTGQVELFALSRKTT
jgi:adenylate cyclase